MKRGYDPEAPTRPVPGPLFAQDTTRAAQRAIAPTLRQRQQAVLDAIRRRGDRGATPDEICEDLKLTRNSVAPRFTELRETKDIYDTGERRRTPTGAWAAVHKETRP